MNPVILDQYGRPATWHTKNWYIGPGDSSFRASAPRLDADISRMISQYRHKLMLSDSRNIVKSYSSLAGALQQKADFVSTNLWEPVFEGEDTEWGELAERALIRHFTQCDVRGSQLRFQNSWRIASWLLDVDGDFFKVKIWSNGLPKVQSFEAHRIASADTHRILNPQLFENCDPESQELAKTLEGQKLENGIVVGEYGEQLAIVITDGTWQCNPIALVPAGSYWHVTEPEWFSQNRGLPKLIYAIYDWYDLQETRNAEKIKQKNQSKLSITEENTTGAAPVNGLRGGVQVANGAPSVESLENGLIRYFKSNSGSKINFLGSSTPGDSWQRFGQTIEQAAFYAIGWNRALLDPTGLSSANAHAVAEQINYSIFKRFDNLAFFAAQEIQWYISGLINIGRLPANKEWYKWSVAQPPEYAVNQSRNNAATIEALRAGTETHPRVIRAKGGRPLQWLREQAKFVAQAKRIAEEEGVDLVDLLQLSKPGDPTNGASSQPKPQEENDE